MSRRPGIGYNYIATHLDEIFHDDSVVYLKGDKVKTSKPPDYFDRLLEKVNPRLLEQLKAERLNSAVVSRSNLQTDLRPWNYNKVQEANALQRLEAFSRDLKETD